MRGVTLSREPAARPTGTAARSSPICIERPGQLRDMTRRCPPVLEAVPSEPDAASCNAAADVKAVSSAGTRPWSSAVWSANWRGSARAIAATAADSLPIIAGDTDLQSVEPRYWQATMPRSGRRRQGYGGQH